MIAPEMQQYKQLLQTTLDDFLIAQGAQQPDLLGNANKLYNLSLGQPLHQVPLVENALLKKGSVPFFLFFLLARFMFLENPTSNIFPMDF
ncbi:hypothetical protein THIOSC15_2680001 [uncultured Thiomicrorhabdus sp.]